MLNKTEFKVLMTRRNTTQKELAKSIKMATGTLSLKINGKADFSLDELSQIAEELDMSLEDIKVCFFYGSRLRKETQMYRKEEC